MQAQCILLAVSRTYANTTRKKDLVHKAPFHDPNFIGIFAIFSAVERWSLE